MRVEEIGDHIRTASPGGRSSETVGTPGVTKTFQLSGTVAMSGSAVDWMTGCIMHWLHWQRNLGCDIQRQPGRLSRIGATLNEW